MSDITRAIPQPVPVRLGGRDFLAREFRLAEVARVQGWINARIGHPFDRAAPAIESGLADRSTPWRRLVSATIDALAAWPREPGTDEADALLASDAGRMLILVLALGRDHPEVVREAATLYGAATRGEWAVLSRVAWGEDPLRKLMALVDGDSDDDDGESPDWESLRYQYESSGYRGPAFEDLTISQFFLWRRGGKPYTGDLSGAADWEEIAAKRKAFREGTEG